MTFQSTIWTLIGQARDGEERALEDFIVRYRSPVVSFLKRKGFVEEAEDLTQEVFLALFRDGVLTGADPSKGRFRSLLLAVTRNVVGKHIRAKKAKKRGGGKVQRLGDLDVPSPQKDTDFDREWGAHLLHLALDRLKEEHASYHEAITLLLFQNASYGDIAARTGRSVSTVTNHIHRGKAKLATYIRTEIRAYCRSNQEYVEEIAAFGENLAL